MGSDRKMDSKTDGKPAPNIDLSKTALDCAVPLHDNINISQRTGDWLGVVRENALMDIRLAQDDLTLKVMAFWHCVVLAPLATAEGVRPIVEQAYKEMGLPIDWTANPEKQLQSQMPEASASRWPKRPVGHARNRSED